MKREDCDIIAAIIGAPNVGKTTLFNVLTGRAEKVANWPGVTVEVKTAKVRYKGLKICLVDLPGVYTLAGTRPDEKVARDFILAGKPDVVVVLIDATNLHRSLPLLLEVLELGYPVVIAVTKIDAVGKEDIDLKALSETFSGIPVVATSALREEGVQELLESIVSVVNTQPVRLEFIPDEVRAIVNTLSQKLSEICGFDSTLSRWYSLRILESGSLDIVRDKCQNGIEALQKFVDENIATKILTHRLKLVESIVSRVKRKEVGFRLSVIDKLFLHPLTGLTVSLVMLASTFMLVFTLNMGFPLNLLASTLGFEWVAELLESYSITGLISKFFDWLASLVYQVISDEFIARLVADGVLGGLGLVISLVPLIALVYAVFGALEDSGLASRMAVSFDIVFRKFGVSGKALFPLITSLGCNVPAIFVTRVADDDIERRALIFAVPFVPCQARLIVTLGLLAWFAGKTNPLVMGVIVALMYGIGFLHYLVAARIFTWFLGKRIREELVLELPPLKKPSLKVVWWHISHSLKHFLIKASTIIVILNIISWLLINFSPSLTPAENINESVAANVGKVFAPVISALFGVNSEVAWRLAFAFLQGLIAKEVFLTTLGLMSGGKMFELTLDQLLLVLIAVNLYMPCIATLSAMYSELRNLRHVMLALLYSLTATLITVVILRGLFLLVPRAW